MKKLVLFLLIFPVVSFNKISLDNNIILLSDPTVLEDKGKYFLYGTRSGGSNKTNDGFLYADIINNYGIKLNSKLEKVKKYYISKISLFIFF